MSLKDLRQQIDGIDGDLVRLLNARAATAIRIGHEKRRMGAPLVDPAREGQVLARVAKLGRGPLRDNALQSIYRVIIEECTKAEREDGAKANP
jgi:chorismate mutase